MFGSYPLLPSLSIRFLVCFMYSGSSEHIRLIRRARLYSIFRLDVVRFTIEVRLTVCRFDMDGSVEFTVIGFVNLCI